jgi:hypothetical protein
MAIVEGMSFSAHEQLHLMRSRADSQAPIIQITNMYTGKKYLFADFKHPFNPIQRTKIVG